MDLGPRRRGNPPLRVDIDMPVFDKDSIRIGTVARVFGGIFQLSAPWRDLWLGYESVAEVIPGQYVQLGLSCDEIESTGFRIEQEAS